MRPLLVLILSAMLSSVFACGGEPSPPNVPGGGSLGDASAPSAPATPEPPK